MSVRAAIVISNYLNNNIEEMFADSDSDSGPCTPSSIGEAANSTAESLLHILHTGKGMKLHTTNLWFGVGVNKLNYSVKMCFWRISEIYQTHIKRHRGLGELRGISPIFENRRSVRTRQPKNQVSHETMQCIKYS